MFGFAGGESPQTVARKNLDQSGCAIAQAKRQHPANRLYTTPLTALKTVCVALPAVALSRTTCKR